MEENVIGMPDSFFERLNKKNGFADDTTAAPVDSGTTPVATDKTIPSGMPDSFFEKLNSQQHYADTNNWAENYKRYIPQAEENPSAWDNIKNNFFAIKDASEASMYGGLELMSQQGEKSGNANFANFIKAAGMYYGADPNWLVKNMQENEAQSQEELKRVWLDPKMGQFNATDMFADPKSFFQTQLPQMLGGSATLMAAGMGIAKGVQTGVMAIGAAGAPFTFGGSAVAAGFIGGAVASAISRPIESLMEGYGAFDEAYSELAKKYPNATHQQLTDMAMPVFNKTFDENMQLQVLDAVQLGLSIIPVTAWGKGALSGTGAIGRMARRADMMRQRYNVAAHIGETAFQMGTGGWEEGRQMQITNEAINKYVGTDKPTSWYDMLNTKEGQSAVSGGSFMGGMMEAPGMLKLAYNKLTGVGDDIKTKPYEDIKQKQTALFYGNIAKSVNEGTTNEMMQAINKFGRSGVLATVETDDADSRNKSSIAEAKRLGDEVAEQVGVFSRMKEQYPDVSEKGLVRMFQNNALIRNNANALKTLSEDNVTDTPIIQRINAQNEALNKENNDIIAGKDVWETPSHEDPFADPEKDKEADIPFDSVEEVEAARLKEIEALQQIPTDGMTDEQMYQRAESLAEINSRYEDLKNRLTEKINDAKGHYENQRVLTEMLQNNIPVEGTIQKAYGMHYDFVTQDGKTVRFYNQATHDVVDDNDFNGSAFLVLRKAEQGLDGTYKDEKGNYLFRSVLGDKDHAERIEVHTTDKDGNDKYLGNVAVSNAEDYNIARDRAKAARMEKLEGEDGEGEGFSVSDEQLSGVKTTSNEQAAEAQSYGFRNAYHALNSVNKYFDADYTDYANIPKEDLALVGRIKQEEAASATTTTPPPDSPPPSEPDTPPAPPTPPPTPPPAPQSPSPATAPSGTTSSTDSGNAGYERTERSFDKVNVGDNITHNGKQGKVFAKVRPKGSLSHPVVLAKDAEGKVFRVTESEYKGTKEGDGDNVLKTNGKLVSYRNDVGKIVVDEENNVIFEGNKSSVELGKTTDEEFAAKSIGDIGISYVNENSLDQAILVGDTVYVKGEEQELVRINYDKNDNVVSYTYKNSKGQERTNRNSETALYIAIQKNNQEFDKSRKGVSDEVKQRDEEHISGVVKAEYGDSIGYILETMPDEVYDTFDLMEAGVTRIEQDAIQYMVLRTIEALADARKRIEGSNATKKEKGSALSMIEKFEKDLNKYYGKLDKQSKVSAKDVAKANTRENNKGDGTVQTAEQKTEAYHADKAVGKETELVKAVEDLLQKNKPTISKEQQPTDVAKEEGSGVGGDAESIKQIAKENGIEVVENKEGFKFKSGSREFQINHRGSKEDTIRKGVEKMIRLQDSESKRNQDSGYYTPLPLAVYDFVSKSGEQVDSIQYANNKTSAYIKLKNGKKIRISNHEPNTKSSDIELRYDQKTKEDYENEVLKAVEQSLPTQEVKDNAKPTISKEQPDVSKEEGSGVGGDVKWWLEEGADVEKMTDTQFEERVLANKLDDFDQQLRKSYKNRVKAEENKGKYDNEDWGKFENKGEEQKVTESLPKYIDGHYEVTISDGTKRLVKARTQTDAEQKVWNEKGFRQSGEYTVSTNKAEYVNYPSLAKAKQKSIKKGDELFSDENGKAITFYHGTDKEFSEFKPSENKYEWKGIFFAFDKDYAKWRNNKRIVEANLVVKNHLDVTMSEADWAKIPQDIKDAVKKQDIGFLKSKGYDAVILKKPLGKEIVVFDKSQIKEQSIKETTKAETPTTTKESNVVDKASNVGGDVMPKEVSDLYSEAASLRFTLNALKQQMRGRELVGKSKAEYESTKTRLDNIELKLSEYEKSKSQGKPKAEEVKKEKAVETKQTFEAGDEANYYDDLFDKTDKVKILYKTGDGENGTERYQVKFENGQEASIWSDKLQSLKETTKAETTTPKGNTSNVGGDVVGKTFRDNYNRTFEVKGENAGILTLEDVDTGKVLRKKKSEVLSDFKEITDSEVAINDKINSNAKVVGDAFGLKLGKSYKGDDVYVGEIKNVRLNPKDFSVSEFGQEEKVNEVGAENVDLSEPIETEVQANGAIKVTDGHHRLWAARKLGKDINVNLTIPGTKIKEISPLLNEIYQNSKADGTNPELVKAVEQSLKETTQAETTTPKGNTSNVGGDVERTAKAVSKRVAVEHAGHEGAKRVTGANENTLELDGYGTVSTSQFINTLVENGRLPKDALKNRHIQLTDEYATKLLNENSDLFPKENTTTNKNETDFPTFESAKNEYDAVKEKYNKHLKKDGGLRANTPDNVKKEIEDAYTKMQSMVKQERNKRVSEDKRDTGLIDGIERIKDNTSAFTLVRMAMNRGVIPERQYNEFGKNLLHIIADAKDSHEVTMQTAEIIQDFSQRANVKVDDALAREIQAAENLKYEPVEQSLSKQESGGKAPVTKPEGKSDVVVDKASNVGGDVEATAKAIEKNPIFINNISGDEYYHGTSLPKSEPDFTTANKDKGVGVRSNAFMGTSREQKSPFFFITSERDVANDFSQAKKEYYNDELKPKENHTSRIIPFKFDEKNSKVLDLTKDNYEFVLQDIGESPIDFFGMGMYEQDQMWEMLDEPKFAEKLKSLGYDAVKFIEPKRGIGIAVLNTDKIVNSTPKGIAEAYHKAKADGSNPELVKAVEEALSKPNTNETTPTKEGVSSNVGTFSGESNSIKYQIEEFRDEPLSSVNPALAEYIRQRMQRLFPSVALFSDKASFEAAAKKVSKGVTFSSAYIGAAIKNMVYVDAEKALQHTEIHEYAHIYWDALPADHPLKTALLDKFGGNEEATIDAIGRAGTIIMENELDIAKSGFFEKWLKKFWAAVKGVFTSKSIEQAFAERLLTNADEVTEENITSGVVKYMKMKSSAKYSELSEKAVKGIEKIIGKKISSLTFPEYYKHISTEIKPNDFKQWKMLSPQKFLEKMYGIVSPVSTLSPSNKAVFMKQYREYLDDYNWAENNVWTRFASGSMTLTVKEIEDLYMEAYKRKSYGTKDAVNFLADLYSKAVMYKNMQQEIKGDTFNKPFAKISFDMMSGHEITDLSGSEFVSGKYSLLSPDRVKETILQGREKLYREVQRNATIKEDALKNDFDAIWKRVKDLKSDLRKIVDKTGTYFIDRNSSAYKALRGGTAADRALADLLDMHYKYESAYGGLSMEKGKYRVPVARMDFGGLAKKFGFKEGMRRYFAKPSKYDNVIIDVRSLGLSKPLMTLKQARQEMVKGSNAIYPFQMLKLTKKVDALTKEAYKQFNSGRHANGDIVTTEDLSGSRYGVSFVKDDESSEDLKVSMMLYHYANIENESYDLLSPYSMYIQKYLGRKDKPNMLKWVKMLDDDLIKGESPTSNLGVYAKYVQALTNYTHWLQLGFNIAGMPFNAFAGFAQSVREIGFRNTLRGLRRVIGSLTVGGGAGVVNAKAISIMEKLHIVSLSKDLEMSVTSKIGKGISKIAFLPVSFVEYINHAYSFIGAMDDAEWERLKALPANASAEDYTKAMGGNERVDELHTLTQKINGAYSKYSRRGINKTAEGRALMQFKNWLPDVIFAHLTVSQLNEAGEDLYGEYQSGIATSIKNTVWNKTIIPMFKDKSIAQAKKNWETLSEHEQMQVGKAMRQLVILGGMALWIASLDDRDDKELKRMLRRAMGDVTYIFDVSNMQFLFDNTVPVFGTIKNLLGLVAEVFSTATGNPSVYEKRQGSHMRGDLKLPVMIENQTPVVNKISKLVNEGD